jgi:hypothetical protein
MEHWSNGVLDYWAAQYPSVLHFFFTAGKSSNLARQSRNENKRDERSPSYISPVAGERREGAITPLV